MVPYERQCTAILPVSDLRRCVVILKTQMDGGGTLYAKSSEGDHWLYWLLHKSVSDFYVDSFYPQPLKKVE